MYMSFFGKGGFTVKVSFSSIKLVSTYKLKGILDTGTGSATELIRYLNEKNKTSLLHVKTYYKHQLICLKPSENALS